MKRDVLGGGSLRHRARRVAWRLGYDVRPFDRMRDPFLRLAALCEHLRISLVVDVGANDGCWVADLREAGYRGPVASFEPHPHAFEMLAKRALFDPSWNVQSVALGAADGSVDLRLTDDSHFSSILPPAGGREETKARTVHRAELRRLDRALSVADDERVFLKIDAQGYEMPVLDGASGLMRRVIGAAIEVNLIPMYEGQPGLAQMIRRLEAEGLRPAGVLNGGHLPTGEESFLDLLAVRN